MNVIFDTETTGLPPKAEIGKRISMNSRTSFNLPGNDQIRTTLTIT